MFSRIAIATLAVASLAASAQEPTLLELATRTREARLAGDHAGWLEHGQATLARAPDHPDLLLSTSRALAAHGRNAEALELLAQSVARGTRTDIAEFPEYAALAADERFKALVAQALENRRPVAPPEVFLVVENTSIEPEGITWDAKTGRLFIGSLNGEIWQIGPDGELERFAAPASGLREVLGLKVDATRRRLWAATGVFPDPFAVEPKKDAGLTGLMSFDLDDGERVSECWLDERPVQHGFNDMALAANGDVYVSDSPANAIYRLPGGQCRLERVVADPRMSFPNGLALSADESRLYVAHVEGLSVVDVAAGRRSTLAVPPTASVNSMDGLVRDGSDLIGIQPSTNLSRVIRIRLSDDGTAIREVVKLSSPPPDGLSQTTGVLVGAHFYSVASQPGAPTTDSETDRRARILRATLR
jgi:sugar lactone lactonase YvrE